MPPITPPPPRWGPPRPGLPPPPPPPPALSRAAPPPNRAAPLHLQAYALRDTPVGPAGQRRPRAPWVSRGRHGTGPAWPVHPAGCGAGRRGRAVVRAHRAGGRLPRPPGGGEGVDGGAPDGVPPRRGRWAVVCGGAGRRPFPAGGGGAAAPAVARNPAAPVLDAVGTPRAGVPTSSSQGPNQTGGPCPSPACSARCRGR